MNTDVPDPCVSRGLRAPFGLAALVLLALLAIGATTGAQEQAAQAATSESTPPVAMPDAGALAALQGGVPSGAPTNQEIALTLAEAIERALRSNLAAILGQAAVDLARGARREQLADLLPQLRGGVTETRQKINLAAFGLTLPDVPPLVGPFNVFDARAYLQQSVVNLAAVHRAHGAARALDAARQDERSARDLVVLACGQLYLQALADQARILAARAQLDTANTLLGLARDRKSSGLAAGIEVLRAEVQAQSLRQRLIVAEQQAAKDKLALARAIGMPIGQRFRLADAMPFSRGVPLSAEEAVTQAWRDRPDLKAEQARAQAAEEAVRAARSEALPSLAVSADYGAIGNDPSSALATYTLAAALRVPVFEGGRAFARASEAAARLRQERARLEDLRARIYYEVQSVFLDLRAAEDRVNVAEGALTLARQQLEQAKDRFSAGVADNLEVVQAQEALAAAEESRIASLYAHNLARFSLARTLGGAEASYRALVKGQP